MLEQLLKKWNIRFFSANELTLQRRWGKHVLPDECKLTNIRKTVILADAIRDTWGSPVTVNSGYRSEEYNKLVGGEPKSEHRDFKALDLSPKNGDIEGFRKTVRLVVAGARAAGWNIGLGHYNTFLHIDTDANGKAINRTWDRRTS